jgi:hypothetical protein
LLIIGEFMKRQLFALLLIANCSHAGPSRADENADRNVSMNQCIALLKTQDKDLKNGWRGRCNETELEKELAEIKPLLKPSLESSLDDGKPAQGDTCDTPLNYTPISRTSLCGRLPSTSSNDLLKLFSSKAVERIRLPGGQCVEMIPLLLANKTDFACNTIQTHIACMDAKYDSRTDTTTLTFHASRDPRSHSSTVTISAADMKRVGDRPADLVTDAQFALVPKRLGTKDVVQRVLSETKDAESACVESGRKTAYCAHRSVAKIDQILQEYLRRYRNPKKDSPADKRLSDAKSLVAAMRTRGVDRNIEQWLLFQSESANEVGLEINESNISVVDPIYGVSDAVLDYSGLSFGAHQIDIGANGAKEVAMFWDILSAYLANHQDAALSAAREMKACVDLPMRFETIAALDLTYKAAPGMTAGLRSNEGRSEYEARMAQYLKEQVEKTNQLSGLFHYSMIARTLYSDHENQSGSGRSVVAAAEAAAQDKDLSRCTDDAAAEKEAVDRLAYRWKDGAIVLGPDGKRVFAHFGERNTKVQSIVKSGAPNGGRAYCN